MVRISSPARAGLLLSLLLTIEIDRLSGAEHEVTVSSFVTPHGRTPGGLPPASIRCRIYDGGYQTLGRAPAESRRAMPAPEYVRDILAEGLASSGFTVVMEKDAVDQMVIFQRGCMDPSRDGMHAREGSPREWRRMLAVLGADGALGFDSEREVLAKALGEPRYFLVISAYDEVAHALRGEQRLLWRTHVSVPVVGLTEEQAVPLMVATAASLFGRETPRPRRIMVSLRDKGILRLNPALRP